jgi:hypothetical protein
LITRLHIGLNLSKVFKLLLGNTRNRQPAPPLQNLHILKLWIRPDLLKRYRLIKLFNKRNIHQIPHRLILGGTRFVIGACRVELGRVGVGSRGDLRHAIDAGHGAGGMVEEDRVAELHAVAHEVAGRVIAHAGPGGLLVLLEVVYGVTGGFGFHEPVLLSRFHS